jgi:tetratricopeptide (TPR) repeat protein
MKKLLPLIIFLSIGMLALSQPEKKLIPVTTNSKSALAYYNQAMKYFDDVNLPESISTFKKALKEDPDFFMVNYQLAFFYLLNRDLNSFTDYAQAAINCKANLSEAEGILKEVLVSFKEGRTKISGFGEKLVEMYPNDPNSYNNLISFQSIEGDSTGVVETLNKAIKIFPKQASFYNQLGYAYLTLLQSDKAEAAFDKYIELDPKNPNVYDSKGDYYMFVKKYDKAYESYMTASSMNPSYSTEKAKIAKQLYEQTEGKTLEIISI